MDTNAQMRQVQTKQISAREMHKYVWILVGVFTLLAVSFPTACIRVSKDKKFAAYNFHLKSLTLEGKLSQPSSESPSIQPVADQSSGETFSGGNTNITHNSLSTSSTTKNAQERSPSNLSAEITDANQLAALNQKLYDYITQHWQANRHTFGQQLEYRVSVSQDGAIASYEPLNHAAVDYLQQTPLPNLPRSALLMAASSSASGNTRFPARDFTQEAQSQFRVVFTSQGILEVSPWQGWGR